MTSKDTETHEDEAARLGRASSFSLDVESRSIGDAFRGYIGQLRTGNPGALPSMLGIVVLGLIFAQVSSRFLSKNNIGNIPSQGAYIAIIALGLVFVLLLGEIDLSAGTAGGMCAAFAADAIFSKGLHGSIPTLLYWGLIVAMCGAVVIGVWLRAYTGAAVVLLGIILIVTDASTHVIPALITAVCIGAAAGIYNGLLVAKVGIPSFIVTLAFFLAWQGILQYAVSGQPISVSGYKFWDGLTQNNMSPTWSWIFTIVLVTGYLLYSLNRSVRSKARGLAHDKLGLVLLRSGVLAVVGVVVTILANQNRNTNVYKTIEGIPYAVAVPVVLMIGCTIALTRTTWGRHLFATGGNAEAARRAGIDVVHIKVTAFTVCSAFGALGGVFLASSSHAVSLDLGAGNILLFSVAAAVIGGTSLFGGRGRPRDAIIGAIVITIIPNGLGLKPSIPAQNQVIITGAVLLVAAAVDALTRRRSRAR